MKKSFYSIIFIFTLFSGFLRAQTHSELGSILVADKELREFSLKFVLGNRCFLYLPLFDALDCQQATSVLVELLDYDLMESDLKADKNNNPSFLFIAFKSELTDFLSKEDSFLLLESLNEELFKAAVNPKKGKNLWKLMLALTHQSPEKASALMGILFQDTTRDQVHLAFLKRENTLRTPTFTKNLEKLAQVLDHVANITQGQPENFNALFFPKNKAQGVNNSIYHFYVPFYLTQKILSQGFSPTIARLAPLILTLSYEFFSMEGSSPYVLSDPDSLDSKIYAWKLMDIYAGYCGGLYGISQNDKMTLQDLTDLFEQSSSSAIQEMIHFSR
jgi:hypothetical protein